MKRTLKIAAAVLPAVLLAAGLGLAGLWLAGWRVKIEPRHGQATDAVMSFAPVDTPPALVQDFPAGSEVRNVVLLIGDGMGFGHVLGARAALVGMNGRLALERLPVTGWLTTHSARGLITDSAAGATALATGFKTGLYRVGVDPEGRRLPSLMEAASARGKAVGLVTDSYLWDATPAAFSTHVESRRDYAAIAAQMAASGFALLIGEEIGALAGDDEGGAMLAGFRAYRVVRDAGELRSALLGDAPVLGLFAAGAIDDPEREPRLDELTTLALARLARDDDGFALLLETEETDTGAHAHDFGRVTRGMAALDRAVAEAVDFARRDRRTLVVVTADHDTGGLALTDGDDGELLRVHWSTAGHTGNPVPLFAYGPGAERLGGAHDNTEVAWVLAELLGLRLQDASGH